MNAATASSVASTTRVVEDANVQDASAQIYGLWEEHEEAIERIETLSALLESKSGDEFDTIVSDLNGTEKEACEYIELGIENWKKREREVAADYENAKKRCAELNLDVDEFERQKIKEAVRNVCHAQLASKIAAEMHMALRTSVSKDDDDDEPASSHPSAEMSEAEAMTQVDVLDKSAPLMSADIEPEKAFVYDEADDDQPCEIRSICPHTREYAIDEALHKLLQLHQIDAVNKALSRLVANCGMMIAHEPGLGKTLTALTITHTFLQNVESRVLLLCPLTLVSHWLAEHCKWKNHFCFQTTSFHTSDSLSSKTIAIDQWKRHKGLLVISTSCFQHDIALIQTAIDSTVLVVIDEAHVDLANRNNQLYKHVSQLNSNLRILLSGTPVQNSFDEYANTLDLIAPDHVLRFARLSFVFERGGDDQSQVQAYDQSLENIMRILSDQEDKEKSMANLFLRRVLKAGISEICHIQSHDDLHITMRTSGSHLQTQIPETVQYIIKHTDRPVDSCKAFAHDAFDASVDTKIALCEHLIKTLRSKCRGDKIVVFSEYKDVLQKLHLSTSDSFLICGSTKQSDRSLVVDSFRTTASPSVLFMTLQIGGLGLNLNFANRVILLTTHYNPTKDSQAVCRCVRFGQMKGVHVYRFIAEKTEEERKYINGVRKISLQSSLWQCHTHKTFDESDIYEPSDFGSDRSISNFAAKKEVLSMITSILSPSSRTLKTRTINDANINNATRIVNAINVCPVDRDKALRFEQPTSRLAPMRIETWNAHHMDYVENGETIRILLPPRAPSVMSYHGNLIVLHKDPVCYTDEELSSFDRQFRLDSARGAVPQFTLAFDSKSIKRLEFQIVRAQRDDDDGVTEDDWEPLDSFTTFNGALHIMLEVGRWHIRSRQRPYKGLSCSAFSQPSAVITVHCGRL